MICYSASGLTCHLWLFLKNCGHQVLIHKKGPDGCLYTKSPNGYINEELFLEWFKKIFIPETNHLRPTLLALDGHGSHGTNTTYLFFKLISLAKEENIHILLLPPHTTNILQPLHVGVFWPLKVNLSKLTDGVKLLSVTGNYPQINKTNFTAVFKEALDKTMCLSTIKNGFQKTGIYPFNSDAIDKTCLIPTLNSTSQETSVTSKTSISSETSNQTALTSPDTAMSTAPGQLNH